jgi:hypothetical protein
MFWFKPFRNFLRKFTLFRNFDQWSEILSMSDGRPSSQGVCPSLYQPHRQGVMPGQKSIYETFLVSTSDMAISELRSAGWIRYGYEMSGYWLRVENGLLYIVRSSDIWLLTSQNGWMGVIRSSEMLATS